jgi:hypothetical protein
MMARFVCPAARLGELAPLLGRIDEAASPIRVSVLGRGGATPEELVAGLSADLRDIESFRSKAGDGAGVEQFEVRVPGPPEKLGSVVTEASSRLESVAPGAQPFFEVSLLGDSPDRLPEAVNAVANLRADGWTGGLKIRCGGLEASAVPTPEAVAAALVHCRAQNVPLKATQGLHHPVRHRDPGLGTTVHGFFNLFVAGVLVRAHEIDRETLLEIVREQDPSAFEFSRQAVAWSQLEADLDQIRTARTSSVTSFGSCSFTEPVDDLRGLGLID